jgi:photosystem II stability/assembly factor-like uncharacterized protein
MVGTTHQDIVYGLAASPDYANDKRCFVARQSGLWRSDDGGEQWHRIDDTAGVPSGFPASAVIVSPRVQSRYSVFAGVPGAVIRSIDSGSSWTISALASPPPFVSALAVSPNYEADGVIFAATLEDGIFRSEDHGVNWQAWNFGLFDLSILSVALSPAFAEDRTVFAGGETGIFCSTNSGRAWRELGFPTEFAPVQCLGLSPQFRQDGILFAGTSASGLFYSDNRGQTWQSMLKCGSVNAIIWSSTVPETANLLVVSSDGLWLSTNQGKSWRNSNPDRDLGVEFTAAAPGGPGCEAELLLGLSDGEIKRLGISIISE